MSRKLYAYLRSGDRQGSLLRRARAGRNISARAMALRADVSHQTVLAWEAERHAVSMRRVSDVAQAYGVRDLDLSRAMIRAVVEGTVRGRVSK